MMSIGEAAEASGVSTKMIRHYERIGLIRAVGRSEAGYRTFAQVDVHTLRFVRRARDLGFSLDAIRRLLTLWHDRSRNSQDVKRIALDTVAELRRTMVELDGMARSLQHLAENCLGDHRPECPIIDELADGYPSAGPREPPAAGNKRKPTDAVLPSRRGLLLKHANPARRPERR